MRRVVVALCGRTQSGKDTAAQGLLRAGWTREMFAGPLKAGCRELFGLTDAQVHGDERDVVDARYLRTPRQILQFMGTEVFQYKVQELLPDVGRGFWAKALCDRVRACSGHVVVTDLRFQHEVDALMQLDRAEFEVVVLKIVRRPAGRACPHASETELDAIRCPVVLNDCTARELAQKVVALVAETSSSL